MSVDTEKKCDGCDCSKKNDDERERIKELEKKMAEEKPAVTHHSVNINGTPLKYTATAGYMNLKDEKCKLKSRIFYVSYVKDGVKDRSKRPIMVAFNGGPGCASMWLHFGALGPKRILLKDNGDAYPPPFKLVENEYSWLEFTDIVIIDALETGFSRCAPAEDKKKYLGVKEDMEIVGDFIRQYISENKRWASPKFLCGESYGTTRAAAVSDYVQSKYNMYLNGIVFVSTVLNFQTSSFIFGNDLPYVLFLPTYAASAWHHKKLEKSLLAKPLEEFLAEVEEWTISEYTVFLIKGDSLTKKEKEKAINMLSKYTGLSPEFIELSNLRVPESRFRKELLRDEEKSCGRMDSRFTMSESNLVKREPEADYSFSSLEGPFTAAANDYVRTELEFENEIPYIPINAEANESWNWKSATPGGKGGHVDVSEMLHDAMVRNRFMKVLFTGGYYDIATPYFAVEYTVNHLNIDKELRANISFKNYGSGHMIYINKPSLIDMKKDVQQFIESAAG